MADAYWRFAGKPAAILTTSGAGIFNACNGIAEAYMNRTPLVCVAGAIPQPMMQGAVLQNTSGIGGAPDLVKAFEPLCVFSRAVTNADDAVSAVRSAIESIHGPRRGPALLVLPKDVQALRCDAPVRPVSGRLPPISGDLDRVIQEIDRAKAPLLIVGDGVKRQGARAALLELATSMNLPVATTPLAGDCFPNRHPNYMGPIGIFGAPRANRRAQNADTLIFVGTNEEPWACYAIPLTEKRRVSLHDGCAAQLHSQVHYSGDLRSMLKAIAAALATRRFEFEPAGEAGREICSPLLELDGFNINSVVKRIGELMPDRVNCMYECGLVAAAGVHFHRLPDHAQVELSLATASMGYAVAGIVGAAIARPERDSIALTADGSLMMHGAEIHTAVSEKLDALFVVLNNRSHGIGVKAQEIFYEGRVQGTTYAPVDCATLARGYGVEYVDRIVASDEVDAKMSAAFERRGVRVVEVVIQRDACPPMLSFLQQAAGGPRTSIFD
jgi:acetolactate synthase-1/2/3 large subunit